MKGNVGKLIVSLALPQLAGALGVIFTSSEIPTWYAGLIKPALNPPSWIFGPVWTLLYVLMGIAFFLVWRKGADKPHVKQALTVFGVQLALNAAWSPVFFGLHATGTALLIIMALGFAIVATILLFRKIVPAAAWLLLPYLAWVSFATYLNSSIWSLN